MGTVRPAPARFAARRSHPWSRLTWTVSVWALFLMLVLGPLATVVVFSVRRSVLELGSPFTLDWYRRIAEEPGLYNPILRSFEIAIIVVVVQLFFGTLLALAIARGKVVGHRLLDGLSNVTIAMPSVVVGLALLAFYGPFGPIATLAETMFSSPFSFTWTLWIVVFAHVLETFPYMVRSVLAGLQRMDPLLEQAARSLGAKPGRVLATVTLPYLRPSLVGGVVLVFSRSVAEFGATIIVVSAVLRTAPIRIFSEVEAGSLELAAAYSVILMATSFLAYALMRWWLRRSEAWTEAVV